MKLGTYILLVVGQEAKFWISAAAPRGGVGEITQPLPNRGAYINISNAHCLKLPLKLRTFWR